ncbi:MAG: family 10 glycosylhydrolase [Clostridia bacterium]|nr:family 10 glycosylhydrolase [Clostridia bacterium]
MKKLLCFICSIFLLITSCENKYPTNLNSDLSLTSLSEDSLHKTTEPIDEILNYKNIKAMWLSQFDLYDIYTDSGKQREINDYISRITTVLENVKNNGYNTIFLQVRPNSDSFFPSKYYPPSKYVTGSYLNNFSYDSIKIIVNKAHKIGLSVHAWINPLRAMTAEEIKEVSNNYLIKKWYDTQADYLTLYNDRYYLNPAYNEARLLIIDGVKEIIENYAFDGVHMDDYFYPTTDEKFDLKSYNQYKEQGGNLDLKRYRYSNLNKLISGIYSTVKKNNSNHLFGISPEGNISNVTDKAYADVYTWCSEEGYIDYICPQIYFGLRHETHPFDKTAEKWANIIKSDSVKLIIGMTFGKVLSKTDKWAGGGSNEWAKDPDILLRCLEITKNTDKCIGVSIFCYQYYYEPLSNIEVQETKQERDSFTFALKDIKWN